MSEWQIILDSTSTHDPLYNGWTYNNQGGDTLQTLSENQYGTDLIIKIELIQDVTNLSHVYYYKGIDIAFCLDVNSPHPFESNIISHNRYCYAKRDNQTEWTEIDLSGEHFDKSDTYWTWTVQTQPNNTSFSWSAGEINVYNLGFQGDPGPGTANDQNDGWGTGRWRIRATGGWIDTPGGIGWSDYASPNTFTYKLSVNTLYRYTPGSTPGADVYIGPEPVYPLDLSNSSTWIQLVGDISSGSHDNEIVLTYYTSNNIPNYIRLNETVVGYTKDDPVIEHYSGMIDLNTYPNIVKLESNSNYLIGIGGYNNNTSIEEIDISNCYNFTTLAYRGFMNCTSLQSVKIQNCPNFLTIRGETFRDCSSISHFKVANCRILGTEIDGIKPKFCEGCTNLNLLEFTDCPSLSLSGFKQSDDGQYKQFEGSNISNLYLYNTSFTEVTSDPDILNVFFKGNTSNRDSANIYFTSPSNYESTNNFILPPSIREYHIRTKFNYPLSFNDIHMHINNSMDVSGTQCSLNDTDFRKLANIYDSLSISLFNFFGKSFINICLDQQTNINIIESKYVFNDLSSYSANIVYGLTSGTYTFRNISSSHPMALLNKDISNLITYTGDNSKKSQKQVTNTTANGNYDFYWGDITVNVVGDFGTLSVYCYNHGYMGGENLLAYSDSCVLPGEQLTRFIDDNLPISRIDIDNHTNGNFVYDLIMEREWNLDSTGQPNIGNETLENGNTIKYIDVNYIGITSGPTLGQYYTLFYIWKPRTSDENWRTLHRNNEDHLAAVQSGNKNLGFYSNRNGGFMDCGHDITIEWQCLIVTAEGTSNTNTTGTCTFYINDALNNNSLKQVGTTSRVGCGTNLYRIGWGVQRPGYIAEAGVLGKKLNQSELDTLMTLLVYKMSGSMPESVIPDTEVLGNWSLLGSEMNGESSSNKFGNSIAINNSGNRVVIGDPENDTPYSNAGECKVYEYNGTSWQQLGQDINGSYGSDVFGTSVTINSDGSRIGIGGHGYDSPAQLAGVCRIYEYNGSSWQQLGQDIRGLMRWDFLGNSVSFNSAGDRIAIGGKVGGWPDGGTVVNDGLCRIYEYDSYSSQWIQLGGDIDGGVGDKLGTSVSINNVGSRVVVGAPFNVQGYSKVLEYNGSSWVQLGGDINDEADDDSFGTSVAINGEGNRIVIGGPENDGNGVGSGHCRIYEYNGSSWVQMGQDLDGKNAGDKFGTSVSINDSGNIIAIGSINNSDSGSNYGNVTVYKLTGTTGSYNWQQLGSYLNGVSTDGYFGYSVSLNNIGDYLAIGANGSNKGFVYKSDRGSG